MANQRESLREERVRLEAEIADLESAKRLLTAAIGELAHDGRRLSDALERMGGQGADIEGRRRALVENRALSEAELKDIEQRLKRLRFRLAELDED